jgi:hypothetical protein
MTLDWSGIATGATPVLLTACFGLAALLYRRMCRVLRAPRPDVVALQNAVADLAAATAANVEALQKAMTEHAASTSRRLDEQERVNAQRHQENREDLRDLRGIIHDVDGR